MAQVLPRQAHDFAGLLTGSSSSQSQCWLATKISEQHLLLRVLHD
jgi:hypothetical protein